MSQFIHDSVTNANDAVARFNVGGLYPSPEGRWYRYVQFKDAVTYAAGQVVTWAATDQSAVTNDISGGSSLGSIVAGICLRVMTQNYYGFILVSGSYATIKTSGADDIAVGESLIVHASTDGTCDGVAANATTTASLGVALAVDVDADNTVAGFVRCM
jgi:hypothetical protein